jgi:prepilin-type processing-associated H-X9-DG protein
MPSVGFSNGNHTPWNSAPVPTVARGDYACSAGDQPCSEDLWAAPGSIAAAKTYPWPNLEVPGGGTRGGASAPATGISFLRSRITMAQVTDGASSTYMLGEKYLNPDCYYNGVDNADNETIYQGYDNDNYRSTWYPYPVPSPRPAADHVPYQDTPGSGNLFTFGSAHATGCNMAFCDGSVRPINYSIDPLTHRWLGNRKDGMAIDDKKM